MAFISGNKAVGDHISDGKELHLFEGIDGSGGNVRYLGEMVCTGTRFDRGPDRHGDDRQEIVFQLLRKSSIAGQDPEALVDSDLEELDLAALRKKTLESALPTVPPTERKTQYRQRSAAIKLYALKRAEGRCEGCDADAPFLTRVGNPYLEVHHER